MIALRAHSWLITDSAFAALCEASERMEQPSAGLLELLGGQQDASAPLYTVQDGIARVDIAGPLMQNPGLLERVFLGAQDMGEIADAIDSAAADSTVRGIMLAIDSPGGTVTGTPELAAAVADASKVKHVAAFTGGLMCSAAYWIGSQADAIYSTPSARVGSIGVIQTLVNRADQLAKAGVKVEVLTAGKYKAAGHPAQSLADEHRAHLQAQIDEIHGDFKAAVTARGRKIDAADMEGQDFSGKVAAQKKLVSGLVNSYAGAVAKLKARIG